jgi:telomere length regulation protein
LYVEENAVNLAYSFLGLQDKYDTPGFDQKRQGALTALVACCPKKAAQ